MIVVQLTGGLGNQMFQYAAGRRLALSQDLPLKIDTAALAREPDRAFGLGAFQLEVLHATSREIRSLRPDRGLRRFMRRITRTPIRNGAVVTEKHFHFDRSLLDHRGEAYLTGYWQSEKYFADIADTIRGDFALREEPSARFEQLREEIAGVCAVALHVRRGDYVHHPQIRKSHGALPLAYYREAVDTLSRGVDSPHFFVFSDEPEWTAAHLQLDAPHTHVTGAPADAPHEDLHLMAHCAHHILSNSTFGWWGAWLRPTPGQVVIAPRRWFARPGFDTGDLIPERWRRI